MNIQLREITVTARDGRVSQLDQVYIRGSTVRFFIVPDMLKNAPMFKQVGPGALKGRGIGLGRGRATVARAQGMNENTHMGCCWIWLLMYNMDRASSFSTRQRPWWFPWTSTHSSLTCTATFRLSFIHQPLLFSITLKQMAARSLPLKIILSLSMTYDVDSSF